MIDLPNGAKMATFSEYKVKAIWEKVKDFELMFSDDTKGNYESFKSDFMDPEVIVADVEGGLVFLKNIRAGLRGEVHIMFWDKHLSTHTEVCSNLLIWAFLQFDLWRIETFVPSVSRAVRRFITKRLGFVEEGVMRDRIRWNGDLVDMHLYSILREEAF